MCQDTRLTNKQTDRQTIGLLNRDDKWAEEEIRETPLAIITNNIKYLGVTLTKQVKDLYDKNFKSLSL